MVGEFKKYSGIVITISPILSRDKIRHQKE
jgi:hypothetical protein